jgi:hypothetical protein
MIKYHYESERRPPSNLQGHSEATRACAWSSSVRAVRRADAPQLCTQAEASPSDKVHAAIMERKECPEMNAANSHPVINLQREQWEMLRDALKEYYRQTDKWPRIWLAGELEKICIRLGDRENAVTWTLEHS